MIAFGDRWLTDSTPSGRFPHYTRANADEIVPGPISPLGWTLLFQGALLEGSVNSWIQFGVFDPGEVDPNDKFGCFGGYLYNALSVTWMLGVRMGASPEVVDRMFYGDNSDGPRYEPHPGDASPRHTAQLRKMTEWVLDQRGEMPSVGVQRRAAARARRLRPDLSALDNRSILRYIDDLLPQVSSAFTGHGTVSLGTSVAVGRLRELLGEQGLTQLTVPLLSALGGVESAGPTLAMWDLAQSASSGGFIDAIDAGEDGLTSLRKGGSAASGWVERFEAFLEAYGARGQCEYDLITPSWETKPDLALGAIAAMCHQGLDRSVGIHQAEGSADRQAAVEEVRRALAGQGPVFDEFERVLAATAVFMSAREAAKFPFVRMTNEVRVAVVELGRRLQADGAVESPHDIAILTRPELDRALQEPAWAAGVVAQRAPMFLALSDLHPPYIVTRRAPPLSQWPLRRRPGRNPAPPGTVLRGIAASPGSYTGRVRTLRSSSDGHLLGSGDILVASTTDAGWTPLLMVVGATVIEVGAIGSHGAIVSRELGIPSVVSCPDATTLLADGALVRVDGTAGTVTVLAPAAECV